MKYYFLGLFTTLSLFFVVSLFFIFTLLQKGTALEQHSSETAVKISRNTLADNPIRLLNITSQPTITPIPTVTTKPTLTITPTAFPTQGQTSIDITVFEHGIGNSGDTINPTSYSLSNQNPVHPQINTEVQIFTLSNQLIASGSTALNYDSSLGAFTATAVPISAGFPTGNYLIRFRTNYHLSGFSSEPQTITASQENTIPPAILVVGDMNNDGTLNILDYNIFIGCYSDLLAATSCTPEQQVASDLNDDGVVNEDDYNLFLRELAGQQGLQ